MTLNTFRLQATAVVFAIAIATPALAQTDLGCFGSDGYRRMPDGEIVYSPILCNIGEVSPSPTLRSKEMKQLYIERMPAKMQNEIAEREEQKQPDPSRQWQDFLNSRKP